MVYGMERGYRSCILLAMVTVMCAGSAGCLSSPNGPAPHDNVTAPAASFTTESPVASVPVADMALQLSDLPSGYILRDRSVIAYAGAGQLARDLGWRQGYQVSFYRLDKKENAMTEITQEIDIYPPDTIREAYTLGEETLLPAEDNATDYQVPFPLLGDRSVAWRVVRDGDQGTIITYSVIFTRNNVYERISMGGTTTDYETLRDIARKAESKIQ